MVFLTFYLSYVASFYVMYLCSIFFQANRQEMLEIKGSGVVRTIRSGTTSCNPDFIFRNTSVKFWPVPFHQRFGRLVEF